MLKKSLLLVGTLLLGLLAVIAANTMRKQSRQAMVAPVAAAPVDAAAAARRLSGAVQLKTVSHDAQPDASAAEFIRLHDYLERQFPLAHRAMKREVVGGYTLLYTWQGSDPKAAPIMLMAHQDVVPVAPGTERDWSVDPFSGAVRDGYVWGRGAWDNKGNLLAMLEAVELLVSQGRRPHRTIYLVAGHDEETGGQRGSARVAELLASRRVRLDFVLDEGTLITEGVIEGLDRPLALVGIAEKGMMTLSLSAHAEHGHASMPPRETAIGMLGAALARIEEKRMPARIDGAAAAMFDTLAPEMPLAQRVVMSNLWLFHPLLRSRLEQGASSNAFIRTTAAPTVAQAGNKANVLPPVAHAKVNFRILPGDSQADVIMHARQAIANPAVRVTRTGAASPASPLSSTGSEAFRMVGTTIRELFPDTIVAPGLMVGAADARHMQAIADHVLRFSPVRATAGDLPRFHGTDERISVANYARMIGFYHRLIENSALR